VCGIAGLFPARLRFFQFARPRVFAGGLALWNPVAWFSFVPKRTPEIRGQGSGAAARRGNGKGTRQAAQRDERTSRKGPSCHLNLSAPRSVLPAPLRFLGACPGLDRDFLFPDRSWEGKEIEKEKGKFLVRPPRGRAGLDSAYRSQKMRGYTLINPEARAGFVPTLGYLGPVAASLVAGLINLRAKKMSG